jgi:hypothetical protein
MIALNRYFVVPPAVYEQIRQSLDAQWGHPNGRAETCMVPAADAIKDGNGNVIAPVLATICEWPEVAGAIAQLTDAGLVTEISDAEYFALQPTTTEP